MTSDLRFWPCLFADGGCEPVAERTIGELAVGGVGAAMEYEVYLC